MILQNWSELSVLCTIYLQQINFLLIFGGMTHIIITSIKTWWHKSMNDLKVGDIIYITIG